MAQYYDNFSGRTVDAVPSDFTNVWGSHSFQVKSGNILGDSDRHILFTPTDTSFERTGSSWDVGTTEGVTTVRLLIRTTLVGGGQSRTIPGPFLSGSGNSSTRTGYVHWLGDNQRISKYDNGSDSAIASKSISLTEGERDIYVEIYRNGDTIEIRYWDFAGSRPSTADVSVTDSTSPLPLSGFFGVSHLSRETTDTLELHEIAVGTNGDTAPDSAPTGATTTNFSADALTGSSFSLVARVSNSISESSTASDTSGDISQSVSSVSEDATTNSIKQAASQASQALSEAIAAGEQWASNVLASVSASESASTADSYNTSDAAIEAASVSESSSTASQFVAALNVITSVSENLTVADAWNAVVAAFGSSIVESVVANDIYQASVVARTDLSDSASVVDLYSSGGSSAARYLIISAITLSAALNSSKININTSLKSSSINVDPKE